MRYTVAASEFRIHIITELCHWSRDRPYTFVWHSLKGLLFSIISLCLMSTFVDMDHMAQNPCSGERHYIKRIKKVVNTVDPMGIIFFSIEVFHSWRFRLHVFLVYISESKLWVPIVYKLFIWVCSIQLNHALWAVANVDPNPHGFVWHNRAIGSP